MNIRRLWPLVKSLTALFWITLLFWPHLFPNSILAQSGNGITAPTPEDTLSGVVIIEGTANHPQFLRYELAFYQEFNPNAGWIVFAEGEQAVVEGTLAIWDTTIGRQFGAPVFPDGQYRLRLRVVRQDYNYDEYFTTNLVISNDDPTPTPTITPTLTIDPSAATPIPAEGGSGVGPAPGVLPSLTPFPTPSPNATPVIGAANPAATPIGEERAGIADQISAIDTTPFTNAVWLGIRLVAYAFGALATYLIIRAIGRWLWRLITNRLFDNNPPSTRGRRRG